MIKARPNGCEEAAIGFQDSYIPCNKPATKVVGWPKHKNEQNRRMCDACADHNVRNRGAVLVGPFQATGA